MRISDWSSDVCSSDLGTCRHIIDAVYQADTCVFHTIILVGGRRFDGLVIMDLDNGATVGRDLHGQYPGQRRQCEQIIRAPFQRKMPGIIVVDGIERMRVQNIPLRRPSRSEEQTSELQSLMRISYADFCL